MNFESMLNAMVANEKQKTFALKPIKALGEVILLLRVQPKGNRARLDFIDQNPSDLGSYRGYYEDLALTYDAEAKPMLVGQLLKLFEEADGKTYTGYKGGDFTMHRRTLVWVAEYGDCGRMLTDITSKNRVTTIHTQEED